MLDISKPLTSGKVQSYYRSEYSAASNGYFSQGGTLRGEWHGQLAAELQLSGDVTVEAFDRLADGQHPHTGEQLIAHRDTIKQANGEELGHRAGWDLTFNAPKTVSLTALVGGDERVREAHRHAVRTALSEIERYAQARMGGNHAGETTGQWIAATFEHDTARPVDGYPAPHLHTHAVLFNLTKDATGQARSLQPYELFKIQSMATAVYQNQLEYDLRQLGYSIERGKNHAPDIRGYSADYLEAESLRAAEIKKGMDERGAVGREAESLVKHQNRSEKLALSPEELRELHRKSAEAFGHQPQQVVAAAAARQVQEPELSRAQPRAQAAVAHARERLTERSAVIEHFEVVRDALRRAQGRVQLGDIHAAIAAEREQKQLLTVEHIRPHAPAFRYTTPELVQVERQAIEAMRRGQDSLDPISAVTAGTVADRFPYLNHDQRQLVVQSLTTRDQIFGVQGGAGTGKTTALEPIRDVAREQGFRTLGLAPTSGAAQSLRDAGIEAETLQSFLQKPRAGEDAQPRLYFLDESSLASGRQMQRFLSRLGAADRVLLIGDTRQHQSVEAGRIFAELQDAGMHAAALREIVRQKDQGLKEVVEAMAAGRIADGVQLLTEQDRVHTVPHRAERFQAIAQAYAQAPEGTLIVSPDNQSRAEINAAVRQVLRDTAQLRPEEYTASILVSRQETTAADRAVAQSYHVGDSIHYLRGSKTLGLKASSYATVMGVDPEQNQITIAKSDGGSVTYDPVRLTAVALYQPEQREFSVGERVQFTTPWKEQGISNREVGSVTYLDPDGNIRVRLDNTHRSVGWNVEQYAHLDHAYAMTSHSSQGKTVDRVLIHVDTNDTRVRSLVNESLAYVATSRPRYDAQLFTDDAEALALSLSRRQDNPMALSPEQVQSENETFRKERTPMPGVVADYVREIREERNMFALADLENALERRHWVLEQNLDRLDDFQFEAAQHYVEKLARRDLRLLEARYPGQEPFELLQSYEQEQQTLKQASNGLDGSSPTDRKALSAVEEFAAAWRDDLRWGQKDAAAVNESYGEQAEGLRRALRAFDASVSIPTAEEATNAAKYLEIVGSDQSSLRTGFVPQEQEFVALYHRAEQSSTVEQLAAMANSMEAFERGLANVPDRDQKQIEDLKELANSTRATMRNEPEYFLGTDTLDPAPRVRDYSTGTGEFDFDGERERRLLLGQSRSGFHYDIENSSQGGEPQPSSWSRAYPTLEAAESAGRVDLNRLIVAAEDQNHAEGLSL